MTIGALLDRRSAHALVGPPPTSDELELLLAAAVTVPDHGGLSPWRFVVVEGAALRTFGDALAVAISASLTDPPSNLRERVVAKATSAPLSIILIASRNPTSRVPAWEQDASAACTGYAIVLAAHLMGLGAVWKSTHARDHPRLRELLHMGPDEDLLGWINVGHQPDDEKTRPARTRVDPWAVTTVLEAPRSACSAPTAAPRAVDSRPSITALPGAGGDVDER